MAATLMERIGAMKAFDKKAQALIDAKHGITRELKTPDSDPWKQVEEMDKNRREYFDLLHECAEINKDFLNRTIDLSVTQAEADSFIKKIS